METSNNNKQGKSQSGGNNGSKGGHRNINKANQNKSKGDKNSAKCDKTTKTDLHLMQAMDKDKLAKKLTPMVCISKIEMKEVKADLTYNLDDVSAMMVKSDNQQLVGPWYLSTMATRDI